MTVPYGGLLQQNPTKRRPIAPLTPNVSPVGPQVPQTPQVRPSNPIPGPTQVVTPQMPVLKPDNTGPIGQAVPQTHQQVPPRTAPVAAPVPVTHQNVGRTDQYGPFRHNDSTTPSPINQFGPDNNLISSQVNPVNRGDTESVRNAIAALLGQTAGGPSRSDIAMDTFRTLDENTADERTRGIREIGQANARFGRLGSGMASTDLGNLEERLQRSRDQALRGLSTDSASEELRDRFGRLGAAQDVFGQLSGTDAGARGEVRGERSYQAGLDQQALDNRLRQVGMEDDLYGNQYDREMRMNQWLSSLGFPGSQNMLPGTADYFDNQAANSNQSASDFFRLLASQGGGTRPPPDAYTRWM